MRVCECTGASDRAQGELGRVHGARWGLVQRTPSRWRAIQGQNAVGTERWSHREVIGGERRARRGRGRKKSTKFSAARGRRRSRRGRPVAPRACPGCRGGRGGLGDAVAASSRLGEAPWRLGDDGAPCCFPQRQYQKRRVQREKGRWRRWRGGEVGG